MISNISDKYLLSSLLQKSIRLGHQSIAEQTVKTLYAIDKQYLSYRMMIIAFEDVGAANLDLMKNITSYRWGVRNFKERNIDFLSYFVTLSSELCQSPKDRSACDATYLLKLSHRHGDLESVLSQSPTLDHIFKSWQALGFKRYSLDEQTSNPSEDNVEALKTYVSKTLGNASKGGVDPFDYLTSFYNTQVEPFFLAVPYLHAQIKTHGLEHSGVNSPPLAKPLADVSAQAGVIIDGTEEPEFVLSAIDGHTRLGSQVLSRYIKEHREKLNAVFDSPMEDDGLYKILKCLLFRVEGQRVSPGTDYEEAKNIKKMIEQKERQYFFPHIRWEEYIGAGRMLKKDLPILNAWRTQALKAEFAQNKPPIFK